jgi:hypothetical protein
MQRPGDDGRRFAERYVVRAFPSGGVIVDLETGNYFRVDARAAVACAALIDGDTAAAAAHEVANLLAITPEHAERVITDTRAALAAAPVRGVPTGPYHFHPEEDGYGLWHAGKRVLAVGLPDLEVSVPPGLGIEQSPLLEFYVRAVAPKIMFTRGLSVLHAASCRVGEKLLAFAGQSGAGKTTTARAFVQAGATSISEDLLVFKATAPRPTVALGSEERVHGWAKRAAEHLAAGAARMPSHDLAAMADGPDMPLSAVLFVDAARRAGSDFVVRSLSDADGLLALMENDFLGASSTESWRQFIATATALCSAIQLGEVTAPAGVERLAPAAARYMSSWTS